MSNIIDCGKGIKVELIGSLSRESYVDIAATITRSEKKLEEIISMDYNAELVNKIVNMNHLATTEFDYFVFAVEGLSRVTEAQLVRKRLASFMIKSGRVNKKGKRSFDIVKPQSLDNYYATVKLKGDRILLNDSENLCRAINDLDPLVEIDLYFEDLVDIIEQWYNKGVKNGLPEEDLRYIKPQGTEFKGLIAMNGHALLDWFKIRCCKNAQLEIRTLANEMLRLVKEKSPSLFSNAGPSCKVLGYCPENKFQNKSCIGIMTHDEVKELIKKETYRRKNNINE